MYISLPERSVYVRITSVVGARIAGGFWRSFVYRISIRSSISYVSDGFAEGHTSFSSFVTRSRRIRKWYRSPGGCLSKLGAKTCHQCHQL